jgi:hypothetical protein
MFWPLKCRRFIPFLAGLYPHALTTSMAGLLYGATCCAVSEQYHLQKMCAIAWCYTGDPADGAAVLSPFAIQPTSDHFAGPIPFPATKHVRCLYPLVCNGFGARTSSTIMTKGNDLHVKYGSQLPTMF